MLRVKLVAYNSIYIHMTCQNWLQLHNDIDAVSHKKMSLIYYLLNVIPLGIKWFFHTFSTRTGAEL